MSLSLPEDLRDSIDQLREQMAHLNAALNDLTGQSQPDLRTQMVKQAKSVMPDQGTST